MSSAYPEPPPSCLDLQLRRVQRAVAVLAGTQGHDLEVAHLPGVGWSFELRFDRSTEGERRQPFTGLQEEIAADELEAEESKEEILLRAGDQAVRFARATGEIVVLDGEREVFRSAHAPFTAHPEPVEIYHNVMAYEHADLSRHRWYPSDKFCTRMVRFQYPRPEGVVLGLPGHTGEANRNGYRFELRNYEQPSQSPNRKPLYQSWPILFHAAADGKGWVGIFADNPSHSFVDVGDFYKDRVTFESVTGNARVYVVHGASPAEIAGRWQALLGSPPMPPLWAFGYQQCRWGYASTDEIRSVAARLREADIPCDALYFDIDYMDGYRVFTVDPQAFGDTQKCLMDLRTDGFQSVCIMDPGVKIDDEYPVYGELKKIGAYFKTPEGEDLVGAVWPGKVIYPDFGSEKAAAWWARTQKEFLDAYPFAGVWNDMNEPINWDGGPASTERAVTERGPWAPEWNLYGYYMARTSARGWREHTADRRTLTISRSGYPGIQRHAIVWHGDNSSWWEHLRLAVDTAVAYALCGVLYNGPDVPGWIENAPPDLAVRFFQLGAFLPFFRGHSMIFAEYKEPYVYPEPARTHIRDAIRLRYALLREWYSGFERCLREKRPTLEPVFDAEGALVRDTFLLLGTFLVCPVVHRDETVRKVWLPAGDWYRYGEPGERLKGGRWILEDVTGFRMPLYVRAGSILTLHEPARNAEETLRTSETHVVYPDARGRAEGYLFVDDGVHVADPQAERWLLSAERGGEIRREPLREKLVRKRRARSAKKKD